MPGSTAKTVAGWTAPATSEAKGPELAPRASLHPVRRLPVERDWPFAAIAAVQATILIGILAAWEIGADTGFIDQFFWSQPSAIFRTLTIFFATGDAFIDIAFTFRSTILGFFIGTVAGAALGLSFWWSRNYAAIVQPYVICFESLPKLALAPLIVLVFGIGLASKVAIATALTLVVSTLTTYGGVKAVDPDGEKLFYSLGATRFQVFRKLVIPSCVPWIISVLRVNIGLALTGAVVGEFIASEHGLGRAILYAGQTYDIALVWVAVLVLSALAMIIYVTVSWIERLLSRGIRSNPARNKRDARATPGATLP
jgi:NitT/TauT family transport system permease protein